MDPHSGVHIVPGEPAVPESQTNPFYSTGIPTYCIHNIVIQVLLVAMVHALAYLFVKIEYVQQFNAQQQADLVELLGDAEMTFKVTTCQRV